jgi:plasmid stabilization system protein ParE
MAGFRLPPEAEAELDDIWLHIARDSGSTEIATRVVDAITERFWLLAQHPYMGRRRDRDLGEGLRSFTAESYLIIHRVETDGGEHRRLHANGKQAARSIVVA